MQNAKETVFNVTASATSGLDKTTATVQEKVDKMTAHDPVEKEVATQKKQDKINRAELNKQMAIAGNAASTDETRTGTGCDPNTGTGYGTGGA